MLYSAAWSPNMEHWQGAFVGRPLPRPLFLAVRWARMTELWAAYEVRRALMRLRFLRILEVDFDRVDLEQQLRYQAVIDAALLLPSSPLRHRSPRPPSAEEPMIGGERGIWV